MSALSSGLSESFERFKKSILRFPVSFLLVFLLDIALMRMSIADPANACFVTIIIGLITVFGFVWLGVNEPKKLIVLVTVVFLSIGPVYAVMLADSLYDIQYPDTLDAERYGLSEVDVNPYIGDFGTDSFNFSAKIPGYANDTDVKLKIMDGRNLFTVYYEGNMTRMNGTNETIFYSNVELEHGTYCFRVIVYKHQEVVEGTDSFYYYGPQNMEKSDFILISLPYALAGVFLQISGLSYILVGMYWWTRVARGKRKEMVTVRKSGEGTKCPICEHPIPYGTKTCPYCNAELEYEEKSTEKPVAEEKSEKKE